MEFGCALGVSRLSPQTGGRESLFFGGEEVGGFRRVGENEPGRNAEDESGNSFDNHDPSPATLVGSAVHMSDCIGEQTATGSGKRCRDKEVADAEGEFALGVEEGEVDCHARKQSTLDCAEK